MKKLLFLTAIAAVLSAPLAFAQNKSALKNKHLTQLTQNGITLKLGGEGEGYVGEIKLRKNGKGKGGALTDAGQKLTINGTWSIKGDQFCRAWKEFDDGNEVCETWVSTSPRSVDVYKGDIKIGVNSW